MHEPIRVTTPTERYYDFALAVGKKELETVRIKWELSDETRKERGDRPIPLWDQTSFHIADPERWKKSKGARKRALKTKKDRKRVRWEWNKERRALRTVDERSPGSSQ